MSPKNKKPRYPFMVFRGAIKLPDDRDPYTVLHDPNASTEDKDAVRRWLNAKRDVAVSTAERDTQKERHKKDHDRRNNVLAELKIDEETGRPMRGEPRRLADKHGVPLATVQGWIEQRDAELRRARPKGYPTGSRAVYHGLALSAWYRAAGRHPKKRAR